MSGPLIIFVLHKYAQPEQNNIPQQGCENSEDKNSGT
jgi:hypothetical protein